MIKKNAWFKDLQARSGEQFSILNAYTFMYTCNKFSEQGLLYLSCEIAYCIVSNPLAFTHSIQSDIRLYGMCSMMMLTMVA